MRPAMQQHARHAVNTSSTPLAAAAPPARAAGSGPLRDAATPESAPTFALAAETLASSRRNWNEAYQEILEMAESVEKFEALRDLARDFEYAAQLYARLIVSEVCLAPESKSIRPIKTAAGSVNAGGTKFICAGSILFKVRMMSVVCCFFLATDSHAILLQVTFASVRSLPVLCCLQFKCSSRWMWS